MDEWVDAFLSYLTVECGLAENTLHAYRRDLGGFVRHIKAQGRTHRLM